MVYEGVFGVRINIRGQSSHTAVYIETKRKMMMMYRGLDVDRFTQEVNKWLAFSAPVIWGRIRTPLFTFCHVRFRVKKRLCIISDRYSPVMSLRWKSRSRCLEWMEIRGLQVGFRAPLLTVYLLQGGGDSIRQCNHFRKHFSSRE